MKTLPNTDDDAEMKARLGEHLAEPVRAARWAIAEFTVYRLSGRWRAVRTADPALTVEHTSWDELSLVCAAVRIRCELHRAAEELTARRRPSASVLGPLGGINV